MCLQQVTALTRHKADPKHRDHWISKGLEIFSLLPVYITLTPESKGTKQPVSKLYLMAGNSGKGWDLNLRKATISHFILNVVKYYINSRILPMMSKQISSLFGFRVIVKCFQRYPAGSKVSYLQHTPGSGQRLRILQHISKTNFRGGTQTHHHYYCVAALPSA